MFRKNKMKYVHLLKISLLVRIGGEIKKLYKHCYHGYVPMTPRKSL